MPAPGETFSGAVGPSLEAAAGAVPHGQIRYTTAGEIRARGGVVEWAEEQSLEVTVRAMEEFRRRAHIVRA